MYIAHPTHGAGTRPNRTQPPTAARKTTLNAGQCVAQAQGRRREEQAGRPRKKKQGGGGGGGRENSPQPPNRPPTPQEAAKPPTQKAPQTGPPKRHRGTTRSKPATPSQEQRPTGKKDTEACRHTPRKKKKKEPAAQPERKGMGGQGPEGPGQGHPATNTTKSNQEKKKGKKHTPTAQPRRAGHSRDLGPARTPTPHSGTENGGRQAERARSHTRPISRPKPKPNHKHHKQPAKEGQHHKPCSNTPTQDPSQDWRDNKTHTEPQPGPKHKRRTTVGNPVPTAPALRQPLPCR